jgi:hypothetical protein
MNGLSIANTVAGQSTEWCLGEIKKEAQKSLPEMAGFNFNLQPYKFTTANAAGKSEISEELKLNRLQAFGRSFAGSLY